MMQPLQNKSAQEPAMTPTSNDALPPESSQKEPRSFAEWVSFGVASLILSVIAGLVIFSWAIEKEHPPAFVLTQPDSIREENGQFYVAFEISNTGGETAESIQIIAELQENGQVEETGDVQINFLASGEKQTGAFVFSKDPRQGQLKLRVSGYTLP
jgi:uncharacterized protein (TIGR02588 family)